MNEKLTYMKREALEEERAKIKTFEAALNSGEPVEYETTTYVKKESWTEKNNT